jgi:anti-sigma B factor antagonist
MIALTPAGENETDSDGIARLQVSGELTIYHAAELAGQLLPLVAQRSTPIELDLDGVTDLDSAGVQVLLVALRAAHDHGGALHVVRPSRAVKDVLETFTLADLFAPPAALTGTTTESNPPTSENQAP